MEGFAEQEIYQVSSVSTTAGISITRVNGSSLIKGKVSTHIDNGDFYVFNPSTYKKCVSYCLSLLHFTREANYNVTYKMMLDKSAEYAKLYKIEEGATVEDLKLISELENITILLDLESDYVNEDYFIYITEQHAIFMLSKLNTYGERLKKMFDKVNNESQFMMKKVPKN